ncbi:MAG: o-succinylbenzoate synthase [Thermodesulfobacteriota bacterium]|nr:o-succinylbenzoate synthase [Thermodesulfobacteriota bacterium]
MRISDMALFEFRLPLRRPLKIGQEVLEQRRGLVLSLTDDSGRQAFGEASPLPGLSRESMAQAKDEMALLRPWLMGRLLPDHLDKVRGAFKAWLGECRLASSSRFALETAVLRLLAAKRALPLSELLSPSPRPFVSVNGLLSGSREEIEKKAFDLRARGYRAFKLKVGRQTVEEDIAMTQMVRRIITDDSILRLDANRAWQMEQALAFAKAVASVNLDYLEEPVRTLPLLKELVSRIGTAVPLALDESLTGLTPRDLDGFFGIKAVVLKPTLLGFEQAMRFARGALKRGMTPVVSSAFESEIGIEALAHMAASINTGDVPAGLDTLDWFEKGLLPTPFGIKRGRLGIANFQCFPEQALKSLTEVTLHG